MKIDFQGQTVLITGATRGLGKQFADDFAALDANLILTGTSEQKITVQDPHVEGSLRSKISYYAVDFTNERSTEKFLESLTLSHQKIDVCINIRINSKNIYFIMPVINKILNRFYKICNVFKYFFCFG